MTEHLTMNTVIHAAFRRDLVRFDTALATFPDGSQERADQLVAAWDNYSHQLHHHHQDEETIFWPAFRELGADESLTSDLGGEHAQMLSALDHADDVLDLDGVAALEFGQQIGADVAGADDGGGCLRGGEQLGRS